MGGYGSGRWGTHLKNYTVEDCLVLNIDKLIRDRLIYAGAHSCGNLIWTLRSTGKQLSMCGYEFDTLDLTNAWLRLIYTLSGQGPIKLPSQFDDDATPLRWSSLVDGLPINEKQEPVQPTCRAAISTTRGEIFWLSAML